LRYPAQQLNLLVLALCFPLWLKRTAEYTEKKIDVDLKALEVTSYSFFVLHCTVFFKHDRGIDWHLQTGISQRKLKKKNVKPESIQCQAPISTQLESTDGPQQKSPNGNE
jgi:hypothetical protein